MNTILGILMDAFFIALLSWCAYTDIRTRTISNVSVILLLCLGLAHTVLRIISGSVWWSTPAGLALCIPFFIVWFKNVMGAGDVKLLAGICLYLGLLNTLISFVFMIPVLIVCMIYHRRKHGTIRSVIPFAPVLAVGAIGVTVMGYLYDLACM